MERRYTRKPLRITSVRLAERDLTGIFLAAQRVDESQSEFVRLAVRERIAKILGPR